MILSFKPRFVPLIKKGIKDHTIREDVHDRWKVGRAMHMATGVRTKKYKCFKKTICRSVEYIDIIPHRKTVYVYGPKGERNKLTPYGIEILAECDGFSSSKEFFDWFWYRFHGKIISWRRGTYSNSNLIVPKKKRPVGSAIKPSRQFIDFNPGVN